ncbi:exoribonuclease II [Buchnera aphidicola (Mindarus keteleerifoliae)]|uniref:exoribonuclease II n=1 Tax=Buchnera aphidicola TaxID=9 RepID=UPI0031B6E20C
MFYKNPLLIELKKKLGKKKSIIEIEGIIKTTQKKFGFLETNTRKSYFISSKEMKKVIHGDRVKADIILDNNKETVYIKKLLAPSLDKFIGKIQKKKDVFFIVPENSLVKQDIFCSKKNDILHTFQEGDWVIAKLVNHKLNGYKFFFAELIEFIISSNEPFYFWNVILSKYNLKKREPLIDIKNDIEFIPDELNRKNLTNLDFFTIDNDNTKDIDDALFIQKKKNGNVKLIVAIADPTSYISVGSKLDELAKDRSFTSYFPGFNVPMLPRSLSENLCSLRPNKRRPSLVCKMLIDEFGNILQKKTKFFLAWIKSREQLTYLNVSNWLNNIGNWKPNNFSIKKQLILLKKFCLLRIKWRKKNALIFKERPEYRFQIDPKGKIINIYTEPRKIGNRIVEEAMISANISAANILFKKLGFGIYNTHVGFNSKNAENTSKLLINYGIFIDSQEINTLEGFKKLSSIIENLSNNYLEARIRKFQAFGKISRRPKPHLALGLKIYATWTSPIRKYGDMINHRLLKSIIKKEKIEIPEKSILSKINEQRRKNKMAEREIQGWLYLNFFKKIDEKNKIYTAEIIDVYNNGIKARIIQNGAYVFIPLLFLHSKKNEVVCNREHGIIEVMKQKFYKISDILKVTIVDIQMNRRSIIASPI